MKILEVCTSHSLGGLELYFLNCCRYFSKDSDVECSSVSSANSKIFSKLQSNRVHAETIHSGHLIRRAFKFISIVNRLRPDVIHSHDKRDLLMISLAKKLLKNQFKHVHTRQMNMPGKKRNLYHNFLYKSIDLLISITDKLRLEIIENTSLDTDKVVRLYYGVELPVPTVREYDFIRNSGATKVGVIARIDRKKQQDLIIKATTHLRELGITLDVYLLGAVSHPDYLQELQDLIETHELKDQVSICGFVENPSEIMHKFDIVVLTTGNETFGLVLPEAMRAGVAVIGANGGGVPEIIDHRETGLLFSPNDAQDLAQQIKLLIENPKLKQKISTAGKIKADKTFNIESHFRDLNQLIRSTVY